MLTVAGCNSVYLYDADRETNTKAARDSLDQADPKAVFEAEAAHIKSLGEQEMEVVADFVIKTRDRALSRLVVPDANEKNTSWNRVEEKAVRRLQVTLDSSIDLEGTTSLYDPVKKKFITNTRAEWLSGLQVGMNPLESIFRSRATSYRQIWAEYVRDGGTNSDPCRDLVNGDDRAGTPDVNPDRAADYKLVVDRCDNVKRARQPIEARRQAAGLPNRADAKDWGAGDQPTYKAVEHQIWRHTMIRAEQRKLAAKIAADLKCLEEGYEAAVAAAGGNRTAELVKRWAVATQAYLAVLDEQPDPDEAPATEVESDCPKDAAAPPAIPTPKALLAGAGVDIAALGDDLVRDLLDRALTTAQIEKRSFLDGRLGALVAQLAAFDPASDDPPADNTFAFALTVIEAIESLRDLADATAEPPRVPSLNELVVEREYQRYLLATAKTEQARSEAKLKALEGQRQAIEIEASLLAHAYRRAKDTRSLGASGPRDCRQRRHGLRASDDQLRQGSGDPAGRCAGAGALQQVLDRGTPALRARQVCPDPGRPRGRGRACPLDQ